MKSKCTWCRREMNQGETSEISSNRIDTHGLCDVCADLALLTHRTEMVGDLNNLDTPIAVFDSSGNVITANKYTQDILQKDLTDMEGFPLGIVFECVFAKLSDGCGKTIHCDGCIIRNTLRDTYQSGMSFMKIPAGMTCGTADDNQIIQLLISTEKVKDVVLLRIDNAGSNEVH